MTTQHQQWEYLVKNADALYGDMASKLNFFGAEGWELISSASSGYPFYIFKRPKQ